MNAHTFTRRLFALGLAVSTTACHHSPASAQDKDAVPAERDAVAAQEDAVRQQQAAAKEAQDALRQQNELLKPPVPPKPPERPGKVLRPAQAGGGSGGYGGKTQTLQFGGYTPAAGSKSVFMAKGVGESASIVSTEAMDPAVQSEWREDLNVMDKVLRDSMSGSEGEPMGIRINLFGRGMTPMYVESAGVLLGSSVSWPLAPGSADAAAGADADPAAAAAARERASAWTRARRELRGEAPPDMPGQPQRPAYDASRVDTLTNAILKALPEATNFRHLKPEESVFVTVSGTDADGTPVRLTLKAKKADIDAAAKGTMDAATFKQRVAKRIG